MVNNKVTRLMSINRSKSIVLHINRRGLIVHSTKLASANQQKMLQQFISSSMGMTANLTW